jgi:hypothetical protein
MVLCVDLFAVSMIDFNPSNAAILDRGMGRWGETGVNLFQD